MTKNHQQGQQTNEEAPNALPPGVELIRKIEWQRVPSLGFDPQSEMLASGGADGVKLLDARTGKLFCTLKPEPIRGSGEWVYSDRALSMAFDPRGRALAVAYDDGAVKLWDARTGKLFRTLKRSEGEAPDYQAAVYSVAFDPQGRTLAGGGRDGTVKLWDAETGNLLRKFETSELKRSEREEIVYSVAFDSQGQILASGGRRTTELWDVASGRLLCVLRGPTLCVAFVPKSETLVSGSGDAVGVWEARTGRLLRTLEGHTGPVTNVTFFPSARLLATKSMDETIRLWSCETWETLGTIPAPTGNDILNTALALHPTLQLLAAGNSETICIWKLDLDLLLGKSTREAAAARAAHYTTAKIVLIGDHSVGKSALGHRLIHGVFKEQASTHGQQFWVFPALGLRRADGTECEAILWDFAGQPDYRLVHALFVDNADLALVLFDASDLRDPLHGVGFWLKQLQAGQSHCPIILVAAQTDRGTCSLTPEELSAF